MKQLLLIPIIPLFMFQVAMAWNTLPYAHNKAFPTHISTNEYDSNAIPQISHNFKNRYSEAFEQHQNSLTQAQKDEESAFHHYRLGKLHYQLGHWNAAKSEFLAVARSEHADLLQDPRISYMMKREIKIALLKDTQESTD